MTKIQINAVGMVRAIRDAHYELLKDKSPEERMAFYRKKARRFHANLPALEATLEQKTTTPQD